MAAPGGGGPAMGGPSSAVQSSIKAAQAAASSGGGGGGGDEGDSLFSLSPANIKIEGGAIHGGLTKDQNLMNSASTNGAQIKMTSLETLKVGTMKNAFGIDLTGGGVHHDTGFHGFDGGGGEGDNKHGGGNNANNANNSSGSNNQRVHPNQQGVFPATEAASAGYLRAGGSPMMNMPVHRLGGLQPAATPGMAPTRGAGMGMGG